jgi:hypothetical protein
MEVPRKEKVPDGRKAAGPRVRTSLTAELSDLPQVFLGLWPQFPPLGKIK